jgi:hypothetical protein
VALWLVKRGDEKCSINHVAGETSNEKCFGAQADLKRHCGFEQLRG